METSWRRRVNLITGLIYPYLSSSQSETSHFSHAGHTHGPGSLESGKKYFQGEINLNMNIKKDSPILDVHFHDITQNKEEHYHEVDLSLFPSFLRPRPFPSRVSPLWAIGFKTGVVSKSWPLHFSTRKASTLVSVCIQAIAALPLHPWTHWTGSCTRHRWAIAGHC